MLKTARFLVAVALCAGIPALTPGFAVAAEERPLTNEDVIKMVRAGLGEETVLAKVQGSRSAFDTSVDGLIALKQAGVSDRIVKAMVSGEAPATPIGGVIGGAGSAIDAGLYLEDGGRLTRLEPVHTSVKAGGFAGQNYRYEFRGSRATVKASGRPTFVLSLANAVGGLAMAGPAEMILVRLDAKTDKREVKMGRNDRLADVGLAFAYSDRGGRQYEIKPKNVLSPGQYIFVLGGDKFFDFEVGGGRVQK